MNDVIANTFNNNCKKILIEKYEKRPWKRPVIDNTDK